MRVTLDHIEDIASGIKTFWFTPERPLRYEAGQFIELTLHHDDADDRGFKRWFTVSSSPTDQLLSITTKLAAKPSSFKKHLFKLQPGTELIMSEAMGDFVLPKDKKVPLVYVAGGIGVTPMHSMIKWLYDRGEHRTTHLIYAARNDTEIAFKPLFDTAVISVDYILTETSSSSDGKQSQLTSNDIYAASLKYDNPYIYLSGPEEMVEVFVAELKERGIKASRLVTDYFPGYAGAI